MPFADRKQVLVKALQDPEELVRAAASRALDRIEGLERIKDIFRDASSGDKPARIRAIHFLGYLSTPDAVDKLLSFMQDPKPDIRVASAKAIQINTPERAFIPLMGSLEDPDVSVRQEVLQTISYYRDARSTEFIVPFLSGQDTETACIAAEALGRNGDPRAESSLIKALSGSTDPFLRARAAEALGNLHPTPPEDWEHQSKEGSEPNP